MILGDQTVDGGEREKRETEPSICGGRQGSWIPGSLLLAGEIIHYTARVCGQRRHLLHATCVHLFKCVFCSCSTVVYVKASGER